MTGQLHIKHLHLRQIVEHARKCAPQEACGLLFGRGDVVAKVWPMANIAIHPEQTYRILPQDFIQTLKQLEADGLELIGIFHSHPRSAPRPSATDIREARTNTSTLVHVIVSLKGVQAQCQAWRISRDARVSRVELVTSNATSNTKQPLSKAQNMALLISTVIAMLILIYVSMSLLPPAPSLPL